MCGSRHGIHLQSGVEGGGPVCNCRQIAWVLHWRGFRSLRRHYPDQVRRVTDAAHRTFGISAPPVGAPLGTRAMIGQPAAALSQAWRNSRQHIATGPFAPGPWPVLETSPMHFPRVRKTHRRAGRQDRGAAPPVGQRRAQYCRRGDAPADQGRPPAAPDLFQAQRLAEDSSRPPSRTAPLLSDYVSRPWSRTSRRLAGDRLYAEDRAIIGGLGRFRGHTVMVMGHEKGVGHQQPGCATTSAWPGPRVTARRSG